MPAIVNQKTVDTLRFLSAEAIQAANSGHPGLPLGAAPMALALWGGVMKHNPKNPSWQNRDRFVLSAGHGSALLYSLLHVFGYDVSPDDLKGFRQLHSKTPGHPELGHTPGVEITTGPLGQGVANAVGFAWAESFKAANFNKPDAKLVDHFTYALCGDGCLMEGVAGEAVSLAGTLGLGKLILLYDSNNITIEGSTDIAFTEDVGARFAASGWHVQRVEDGNDLNAILTAIEAAKAAADKPSIIEIKTTIGHGAPKAGTAAVHGSPLGADGILAAKENLGWQHADAFFVPEEVAAAAAEWQLDAQDWEANWLKEAALYQEKYPQDWANWQKWHGPVQVDIDEWINDWDGFWKNQDSLATRQSGEFVLNKLAADVPNLIGGSADLAPSNLSTIKDAGFYSKQTPCRPNLHFGVREHAMTAIANAFAAYGGLRPYVAGFFVFSDYMKPAMRLSAMMKLPVIYIFTHDSIGVGEDGATHQPIEQLAALRSIPNFVVMRPCDTREAAAAWAYALNRTDGPTALILTRQKLPLLKETGTGAYDGAYVLRDEINSKTGRPDILLMASGSEVEVALAAQDALKQKDVAARVISMPSMELFDKLPIEQQQKIMPKEVRARLAIEAAGAFGWHKYVGLDGDVVCMEGYGASAPAQTLLEEFGFTAANVVDRAMKLTK